MYRAVPQSEFLSWAERWANVVMVTDDEQSVPLIFGERGGALGNVLVTMIRSADTYILVCKSECDQMHVSNQFSLKAES